MSSHQPDPGRREAAGGPRAGSEELDRARRVAVDALLEALAAERLAMEEFERRMASVRSAESAADLVGLLPEVFGRGAGVGTRGGGERASEAAPPGRPSGATARRGEPAAPASAAGGGPDGGGFPSALFRWVRDLFPGGSR